jgi:tRNA dimethylallyltransferase
MIVGGTGLYINSLVYDLDFGGVPPQPEYRMELEKVIEEKGGDNLLAMLRNVDPETASKLSPKDLKKIMRALEIFEYTGVPMSLQKNNFRKESDNYQLVMYCLTMDRERLYQRINNRVDLMLEAGLVEEVKGLLDAGYSRSLTAMKGIGYKEICDYLEGEESYAFAVDKIKQGSRNYAKRQLTWFRRDNRIKWIDVEEFGNVEKLHSFLIEDIGKSLGIEGGIK